MRIIILYDDRLRGSSARVLSAPDSLTFSVDTTSAEQTAAFGARLGKLLVSGDVICLSGPLGAGKTALAAGIAKGWGALEPANSPTFVFVHEHHRAGDATPLYHVDCYRLASDDDALSVGIEDILDGQAIAVVEWPERIASFLSPECLWITLDVYDDENARRLTLRATGARYLKLLKSIEELR